MYFRSLMRWSWTECWVSSSYKCSSMCRRQSLGVVVMEASGGNLSPTSYYWWEWYAWSMTCHQLSCICNAGNVTYNVQHFSAIYSFQREPLIQALLPSPTFINQLLEKEREMHFWTFMYTCRHLHCIHHIVVVDGGHAGWALCLCTLTKLFPTLNGIIMPLHNPLAP